MGSSGINANFPFFTAWINSFNNLLVFQIVMPKHPTLLIFSLPPIVNYTLTLSLPLLAPLTTVLLLSPPHMHHLFLSLPLLAVFGTLTGLSVLSFLISLLTFLGETVAFVPVTRIVPYLVSLRLCLPGWRHTSPTLSNLSLHLNLGLIMPAHMLYKLGSMRIRPFFALAPISPFVLSH